jgi:AcrR family transcriptional regulator
MAFTEAGSPEAAAPRSARSAARDASRQKLLDAAAAVFARSGYSASKATDIASRAGVAVGTLYLHFGDKEGIARAVALDALTDLRTRLRRAAMRPGLTPEQAARAHATALVNFVASAEAQSHLLFASDSPALRGEVFNAMADAQEAHLRERGKEGFFRTDIHAAVAAQALVGMQSRVLMWWIEDRKRASRTAVIDTLAKLRLSGIHVHGQKPKRQSPIATRSKAVTGKPAAKTASAKRRKSPATTAPTSRGKAPAKQAASTRAGRRLPARAPRRKKP